MAKLGPQGPIRVFGFDGQPGVGFKLWTYEAGTNTPKPTYTDASESTLNTNPIIFDANGYASLWLGSGAYKLVLLDADDVPQWPDDFDYITGDSPNTFGSEVVSIAANTPITTAYENALMVCTAALTLSLLAADDAGAGFVFSARNDSTGIVTINPNAAELINGLATLDLYPGQSAIVICNGSAWVTLAYTAVAKTLTKTADYSLTLADRGRLILADATAANMAVTLLAAATAGDGHIVEITKTDATTHTVTVSDGVLSHVIKLQNDGVRLVSNGSAWFRVLKGFPVLDEDDFVSNSDKSVATQQSTKAYIASRLNGERIVQTKRIVSTSKPSTASTSMVASGITFALDNALAKSSNKVRIRVFGYAGGTDGTVESQFTVKTSGGGTDLGGGTILGSASTGSASAGEGADIMCGFHMDVERSPGATAAETYEIYWKVDSSTGYINRNGDNSVAGQTVIYIEEIET